MPRPSSPRPPIGSDRDRLARILGLTPDVGTAALLTEGDRLLGALKRRAQAEKNAAGESSADLRGEIAELAAALSDYRAAPAQKESTHELRSRRNRSGLLAALVASALMIGFLIVTSIGERRVRAEDSAAAKVPSYMGRLEVIGAAEASTLRVLDADRERVLQETSAFGAQIELVPGRYALEVDTLGCPSTWTQSVFLNPGATRQVYPTSCAEAAPQAGHGALRVEAALAGGRVFVDGVELGATGKEARTLAEGKHTLRVEHEGYRDFQKEIAIEAGQVSNVRAELIPSAPDRAPAASALNYPGPPVLSPDALPTPEPFDLGDLAEAIAPDRTELESTELPEFEVDGLRAKGGSTDWHDRTSRNFLARYDTDRSGAIDIIDESDAIPCSDWKRTESSFDRGRLGLSMARYYGFDGSEWHPSALGFARTIRHAAYTRMRACGLKP